MSRLLVVTYYVAQTSPPPVLVFPGNSVTGNFEDVASTKRGGDLVLVYLLSYPVANFLYFFFRTIRLNGGGGAQPFFLPSSSITQNLLSQKLFLCKLGLAYIKIIFASLAVYGRNFACVFSLLGTEIRVQPVIHVYLHNFASLLSQVYGNVA